MDPPIRISAHAPTPTTEESVFIFLHGYGDDGHGWTNLAEQFAAANKLPHMTWIFPTAPYSHNAGTNAWFEIGEEVASKLGGMPVGRSSRLDGDAKAEEEEDEVDWEGVRGSVRVAEEMVRKEVERGVKVERIVVGGFSQGGMVALGLGVGVGGEGGEYMGRVGGVVGLSCALLGKGLEGGKRQEGKMKVFLGHGGRDRLVPMKMFREAKDGLESLLGEDRVVAKVYEGMEHTTCGRELGDICAFLEGILGA